MVLDDDFDLAILVKQILQKDGFNNVFSFRPAVGDYSLIISDIRMPIMNGFQFVSEARKINPKN